MTWGWTGVRGTWATPEAEHSMRELAEVGGVNWVTIAFAALQANAHTTAIPFRDEPTVTDSEMRWAIHRAREHGLRVCLKPTVNCADGTWRAFISFFGEDVPGAPSWTEWFESYREFILHYARIAQEEECEMLCVGCEMVQADRQEQHWRALVADVRTVYDGLVTYNCDKYQEDRLTWWDAVDVISSSGYYPSGTWTEHLDRIGRVVEHWGKPFFFMEAGCPSRTGSASRPNDWTLPGAPSGSEQERYYREMFAECAERPWMQGFMLWDWPARLYGPDEAAGNDDYCVYAKPAQTVVAQHYTAVARQY
ncbi:glycoside hydrolase family 113 [Phytoactinopolyspora endophytica]|uniref:glycoside hydrolase family 113 n=1 Tax=Phytoactinopolyspora endophytica TaxID=1642495 RepID=UPI00101DB419